MAPSKASVAAAHSFKTRNASSKVIPPSAAQASQPFDGTVDDWLAQTIAEPEGVPMPRALALLWELRQDVRLHFANRTRAEVLEYIGWCLTQGIRDGCVAVELIEPALAPFLDKPDPELPATRLLRIIAPLYDGPYPDIASQFPHTRQARFCVAVWACGVLRRRHGWPRSFVRGPLEWLSRIADASDAFVPLDNLAVGLWELRPELQVRCDLRTHEGRSALREWLVGEAIEEFELEDLPKAPSQPPIARDLCLVGYACLVSGRAEDLRMSALALSRHSRQWAVLDRLSGAITTEDGRPAAVFAEPPGINLLHLNADTAFFDYLFLRERGIERGFTIGYWAWELAKFPEEWRSSFAFVQEVWAASRFAYEAIAPATTKPVFLMPPAVAIPAPEPGLKRADFGLPDDKFIFYFSFDFRSYISRKNPGAAIAAFRDAFPHSDAPVRLVLKTIGASWKPEDRDAPVVQGPQRALDHRHEVDGTPGVDVDDRAQDVELVAEGRGGVDERVGVLRKAAAAVTEAGLQERRADAGVEPHALHDLRDVGAGQLADIGDGVDERDLRGQECVGSVFDHLR